jgi:hypothetical protein
MAAAFLILAPGCASEPLKESAVARFAEGVHFRFANVEEGRRLLGAEDGFTASLSPADLLMRFGAEDVDYRARAAGEVRDWDADEIALVSAAIRLTREHFEAAGVELPLPHEVVLIQTTGAEEGGAGNYTRGAAIIIQEEQMRRSAQDLIGVFAHELFHVATRYQPTIRDPLYAIIGFRPCGHAPYPSALAPRKITNPDAYTYEHCIEVTHEGENVHATPIILLGDIGPVANSVFDALDVRLLVREGGVAAPRTYALDEVSGYFEQVGRNTDYIIHPEEILADNFSMLVRGVQDKPNPEIFARMRVALQAR